jgi:DNA-binding MarR family transcriptional regulator
MAPSAAQEDPPADPDRRYIQAIAEARYTVRTVTRIIDGQARAAGVEPLQHQALLQVDADDRSMLPVTRLAERLDIPVEVASRLVRQLETDGLVRRAQSRGDRRVTEVHITAAGRRIVRSVLREVIPHVERFARGLEPDAKRRSLMVFAFYLGLDLDEERLRDLLETDTHAPLWGRA